jgi:hypothetical protein
MTLPAGVNRRPHLSSSGCTQKVLAWCFTIAQFGGIMGAWPPSPARRRSPLERCAPAACGHFVLAQLKVEYGQIFGYAIGIGGSRQGDNTILLDEPPEDDFRDRPGMVIGDLRDRGVRQHITAKAELACMA